VDLVAYQNVHDCYRNGRLANLILEIVKASMQQPGCRIDAHAGKGKDPELKTMKA
jgi:hypothetical protein